MGDDIPIATATAVASLAPEIPTSNSIREGALAALGEQGYPIGLARELGNTKATYPLRFWIVDNSGSMMTTDGNELKTKDNDPSMLGIQRCTRWKELQTTVEYHITLAQLLGTQTIFRLLNDPGASVGPQEFRVADPDVPDEDAVPQALQVIRNTKPAGVTPLAQHLTVIAERIEQVKSTLIRQSQKAVVVVATDGLPTEPTGHKSPEAKKEFIAALKELQTLPVWVVFRLCTDEEDVVDFYNDLDRYLESPLEVIDDFLGEANEIHKYNKWLNYTLPLHRCREMGYHHRVFDFLDEKELNKDELKKFLILLFGFEELPDPNLDWKAFSERIQTAIDKTKKEWNSKTKRRQPWINMKELNRQYAPKKSILGGISKRLLTTKM